VNIVLVGLNHKTAPVKVRECLAPTAQAVPEMLVQALALPGLREALLVSTCNRVEVLAAADGAAGTVGAAEAAGTLTAWLAQGRTLAPQEIAESLYAHVDEDAVRHLFRVASSLDSLVVGEPQILGQIKEAFRTAVEAGATGAVLNRLMHKTFQVAKRVRSETAIGGAAVSVSYAAVELARKIFDDLAGLKALLIGAGEMAELAAEHLLAQGVGEVMVANRTLARAVELAGRLARGGKPGGAFGLDELARVLPAVDIVISSTGATEPVITHALARSALKARRGRPLFFIDIAVPRDVEPSVGELDGCFLYDIDDLGQVVESNRQGRAKEAHAAEAIVAEEVVKFSAWLKSLAVVPTIAELTAKAEAIRTAEVARTLKDLGNTPQTEAEAEALERLTRALVKKLLHDPILFLREQAHRSPESQQSHTALVRRMFKLGEEPGSGEGREE
jgi:glutamyl-tRNA reductase